MRLLLFHIFVISFCFPFSGYLLTCRRIWAQLEETHFSGFTVVFDGRRLAFSLKDVGVDSTSLFFHLTQKPSPSNSPKTMVPSPCLNVLPASSRSASARLVNSSLVRF